MGNGWLGFNVSVDEAAQAIARMRQIATDTGRDFDALDISVGPYSKRPQVDLDSLKRYRDLGVRRVVLVNPTTNLAQIGAALYTSSSRGRLINAPLVCPLSPA